MRTVPNSRANSSKQSKLELEPVLGKRSRSASEEPFTSLTSSRVSHAPRGSPGPLTTSPSPLEIRGTESLSLFTSSPDDGPGPVYTQAPHTPHGHHAPRPSGPRRLAKVETIRVLRARSALLLPLPSPAMPSLPPSLSCQPLVLKSEDRKKKRR